MRKQLLAVLAALCAGPALADEPETRCYDVAIQGSLRQTDVIGLRDDGWTSDHRLYVDVIKTFTRDRLPDRIEVMATSHAAPNMRYFQNAVFFLSRREAGTYSVLIAAGDELLDGRGLVSRGRVEQLARSQRLEPCTAD